MMATTHDDILAAFRDESAYDFAGAVPDDAFAGDGPPDEPESEPADLWGTADPFATPAAAGEAYATIGWPIFPCHTKDGRGCTCGKSDCSSPAKHPRTLNGVDDATTDTATISQWSARFGAVNWGMATGAQAGVWVLDVDPRHGGDKTLEALEAEHGELPATIEAKTGGGGRHFVWKYPGHEIQNRTGGKAGMPGGLDVRGDGGYIIVAPARHISGGAYEWLNGRSPLDIEPAEAPPWLLEVIRPQNGTAKKDNSPRQSATDVDILMEAATRYIARAGGNGEGQRNGSAFNLAGHLAAFVIEGGGPRLSESQILDLMRGWNHRNNPPLGDRELETLVNSACSGNGTPRQDHIVKRPREIPVVAVSASQGHSSAPDLPTIETMDGRTDIANARRLVALHGDKIRWCDPWGKWLIWDSRRWAIDTTRTVETLARDVFHLVWKQAGELRADRGAIQFARNVGGERAVRAMISLARSEPGIAIEPAKLDSDGWLLNVRNGTIDLRTGEIRSHNREDLITRLCPVNYDPAARSDLWQSFLETITVGNRELAEFLRRGAGCSAVGQAIEHVLFFAYGGGSNGKTTFFQAVGNTLGDEYAMAAPPDLLMVKHGQQHPTELADLHGKRFVSCIEAGEGRRLAESLVKTLTGGDKLRARRMREDFWQFDPSHTIWLAANHKPVIRGTDNGIWRRIRLVPFTAEIPEAEQDKSLPEKLRAEAPAILAWIVGGCLAWQRDGLGLPEAVNQATNEYREESDVLGEFIDECCEVGKPVRTKSSELYAGYLKWCERSGERSVGKNAFGEAIVERGFDKTRSNGIWYSGIELREGL